MKQKRLNYLKNFDCWPDDNTNAIEHFDLLNSILQECVMEIDNLQKLFSKETKAHRELKKMYNELVNVEKGVSHETTDI